MRVILHADDFGYDRDTANATIELFEAGALTSATIMPNMPASKEAIEFAAYHPDKSFGIHLTYVDGLSPLCANEESSLLDENGVFYPSNEVRKKALLFQLRKQDIIEETLAQIEKVRSAGIEVSHLDSHGHLHKFPSFLFVLEDIKRHSGIQRIRRVQNVFLQKQKLSPTLLLNRCFDYYISHSCRTTDYLYVSANRFDIGWGENLLQIMDGYPDYATIEVAVHPGHADTEDERWRIAEYNDMLEFAQKLRKSGKHQIITWNEV